MEIEELCFGKGDGCSEQDYRTILSRGGNAFVIGQPVRAIIWLIPEPNHRLEIMSLATDPDWRRFGYARKLLIFAISYARKQKKRSLTLDVRVSNHAAISLYKQFGFKKTRRKPKFYGNEDSYKMVKKLE